MLIRKENITHNALLGVWEMTESKEELLELFPDTTRPNVVNIISKMKSEKRIVEWLSSRLLVLKMLGDDKKICHNPQGKPYLSDQTYKISISHTKKYAAVILHPSLEVAIDIEMISNRVNKLAHKFISEVEFIDEAQKTVHQLLHWSAKECLYKLYNGTEEIDFKEHFHIAPFTPQMNGFFRASESKTSFKRKYELTYEIHSTYVLVWSFLEDTHA